MASGEPLITVCCCDKKVHSTCFKKERIAQVRKCMRASVCMPLGDVWDCPECGSAYRFVYCNSILRFVIERPYLWPVLFTLFCTGVFLACCELSISVLSSLPMSWGPIEGDDHLTWFNYMLRGLDVLSFFATCLQVKGRGSLMYMRWLIGDLSVLTWDLLSLVKVTSLSATIVYNVYNMGRDIYMLGVLLLTADATPAAFIEFCTRTASALPPDVGGAEIIDSVVSLIPGGRSTAEADVAAGGAAPRARQQQPPPPEPLAIQDEAEAEAAADAAGTPQRQESREPEPDAPPPPPPPPPEPSKAQPPDEAGGKPKGGGGPGPGSSVESQNICECICCLEKRASFVNFACGHLVACGDCRRRLVYKELRDRAVFGLPKMRDLSGVMVEQTVISCPVCRAPGNLVERRRYTGPIFLP